VSKRKQLPVALTVAGSDSGSGAGIQTDLKTFASLGVHGTCAVTCVTAQNPKSVRGIQPCSVEIVRRQLEAVFDELPPAAMKTGMLYSAPIILAVAESFSRRRHAPPLVVDPVMVSTSGVPLLKPGAVKILCIELLPLTTLVTPNLPEAEVLLGRRLNSVEAMRAAAKELQMRFGCAALVKGGHLRGLKEAVDIFYDGSEELLLSSPFIRGVRTHGTGCTYSAAITSYLARGLSLSQAVRQGKEYITQAIARSKRVGRHQVLNSSWNGLPGNNP
jgi:hydroxymethylpyrimidine kinase/phosphomethylpyrimidine kinase